MGMDLDFAIVGSGFGGSVAALRLAERGHRVAVLEQGRRIGPPDMEAAEGSLRKLLWAPRIGAAGYFQQTVLSHVCVVGGVGVGGGSLVYAGVLLEPRAELFGAPAWRRSGIDWARELAPHYAEASRMLGRTRNTFHGPQDDALRETAIAVGAGDTFEPVDLGIHFGEPAVERDDPYFGGAGPRRTGCRLCGGCMIVGCRHDAKNTLDRNYLYLAEARGARILTHHRAVAIRPLPGGGYAVACEQPLARAPLGEITAREVVLAAGVLGTVELLARSRAEGALPALSPRLGEDVRTNSEAIVAILADDEQADLSRGPGISTHFFTDGGRTHVTNNRFSSGQAALRWQIGPMVDDPAPRRRALRVLWNMLRHPGESLAVWRARNWHGRLTLLTVMQDADNRLALRWRRSLLGAGLRSEVGADRPPAYLPAANRLARVYAEKIGGRPLSSLLESLGGVAMTAHILGGCAVGDVLDEAHQVRGYPGLRVLDASAVPGNVGVNPALTITAMAERALARVPARA